MDIPTLPTDNLYKFIALSGVLIFLFFYIYADYRMNEIKEEIINIETESGELEFETKLLEERQEELKDEIEEVNDELSKHQIKDTFNIKELKHQIQNSNHREYLEFIFKYKENLIPEIKLQQQVIEKSHELKKNSQELRLKSHRIERKFEIIKEKNDEVRKSKWIWIIGSFISGLMMVNGFRLWYTKSQIPMDKRLLKEINEPNELSIK